MYKLQVLIFLLFFLYMPALAKDTHMANNELHPGMPRGHTLCEEGPGEAVLTVLELYWNAGRANRTIASIISRLEYQV